MLVGFYCFTMVIPQSSIYYGILRSAVRAEIRTTLVPTPPDVGMRGGEVWVLE